MYIIEDLTPNIKDNHLWGIWIDGIPKYKVLETFHWSSYGEESLRQVILVETNQQVAWGKGTEDLMPDIETWVPEILESWGLETPRSLGARAGDPLATTATTDIYELEGKRLLVMGRTSTRARKRVMKILDSTNLEELDTLETSKPIPEILKWAEEQ